MMPLNHECPTTGMRCPICEPLSERMCRALRDTWSAIGWDCLQAMSDDGNVENSEMDRKSVIEIVLDCDHIERYGCRDQDGLDECREFRRLPHEVKLALASTVFTDATYCA